MFGDFAGSNAGPTEKRYRQKCIVKLSEDIWRLGADTNRFRLQIGNIVTTHDPIRKIQEGAVDMVYHPPTVRTKLQKCNAVCEYPPIRSALAKTNSILVNRQTHLLVFTQNKLR